jgi:branched-chain amino acid transport system permease protein
MKLTATRTGLIVALLCIVIAAAAAMPKILPAYWLSIATLALVMAIFAASVNLLAGYGGMVTLGQGGILAVSAYGVAYTSTKTQLGGVQQILVALGLVVVVSAIFGAMAVRTTGVYFLMVTLAQGMVVWGLTYSLSLTGGADGIPSVYRPTLVEGDDDFYYLCLGALVLTLAAIAVFVRSPFGLGMRAIQANEARARAVGYNTTLHRFLAFMASGLIAGFAGILFVYLNEYIDPSASYFQMSADGMVMALIGGLGTLAGPIVGAVLLVFIQNVVSNHIERWPTVEGIIFVVIVLYARQGIVGLVKDAYRRLVRRSRQHPDPDPARGELHLLPGRTTAASGRPAP